MRGSFGHGANTYSHSQRSVPRSFPVQALWVTGGQLNCVHLNVSYRIHAIINNGK